ncbi:MAG: hypothetical protein KQH63_00855 [Desulfobulbaceae bacterium]|nr:hypothetical protein [Desulfobulbaceae bacterium]
MMMSKTIEEIRLLMKYAVPEKELPQAETLLTEYDSDRIALNLFRHFYSFLPEGLDDTISKILLIDRKEGVFLLCAITGIDNYLYLVSQDKTEFLGRRDEGIWDEEVLHFFGFKDREASVKKLESLSPFPTYRPSHADENLCPICSAAGGEFHTLGCPVEICPWCSGQLTNCTCRFTITGKKNLHNESDLLVFQAQLEEKGRVPFDPKTQRPTYPVQEEGEQ